MRGRKYSPELRQEAEDLCVEDGLTYEEAGAKTGVPVKTLKRWGIEGRWQELRGEYRQVQRDLKRNLRKLRLNLMKKMADSETLDPQAFFALIRLENLALQRERKAEDRIPDIDRPKLFLEGLEFIAETLREIDPEGLKILSRDFEIIINRFKERHEKAA